VLRRLLMSMTDPLLPVLLALLWYGPVGSRQMQHENPDHIWNTCEHHRGWMYSSKKREYEEEGNRV